MPKKKTKRIRTTQARANRIEDARRYRRFGLKTSDIKDSPFGLTKADLLADFKRMQTSTGSMFVAIEERKARRKSRKTGDSYYYTLFKDKYFN